MLSDVLHDALTSIREYRDATDEPDASWYGDLTEEINAVIAPMDALREYLDAACFHTGEKAGAWRAALRVKLGLPPDPTA